MSTGTLVSLEEYLAATYEPDCDYVDGHLEERNVGEWDHARLQGRILALLLHYEAQGLIALPELRLRVSASRFRVPDVCVFSRDPNQAVPSTPPVLCVEVLSPEDRMSRIEVRINDYLAMGVHAVWVLDPETRQAFTATAAEGLREVKSEVLSLENPMIMLPLSDVFQVLP